MVDLLGKTLPLDPLGGDFEGIVIDPADGSMWMCDEYRPAIYHFDAAGVLIQRYVPIGTAAAAGAAPGTFGEEVLPSVIAQRRQNRGFEAIALDNGKIYAFVQSPLRNPQTLANSALISANEGDAREYIVTDPITGVQTPSFVENVRIGSSSVVLDPVQLTSITSRSNSSRKSPARLPSRF